MNAQPPAAIKLTPEESALRARISFDDLNHEVLVESCKAARLLALSLLERGAVPQIRRDYFTNPRYNVGLVKSRMQVFEENGTRGDDIFEHGNFLKYLQYWIFGPRLPSETIAGFCQILNDDIGTSGVELSRRAQYVREQMRRHNLPKHDAAEEFYKLALEVGLDDSDARSIREAIMGSH